MAVVRILGRVWIPLVIVLVVAAETFLVIRIHGIFGAPNPAPAQGRVADTAPVATKQVRYDVFGPPGTVADISYFDVNLQAQHVDAVQLPWSMTMTVNSAAVIADIVAQGDSDTLGCRIVVDGAVRAERIANEVNAYTHCLVKGA